MMDPVQIDSSAVHTHTHSLTPQWPISTNF